MKKDDFKQTGQWIITLKDKKTDKVKENIFDAVLVCTGRNSEKYVPCFPGLSNFKGKVIHSHDYRKPTGYEGKRVLVIGIGNTGSEIAVELSAVASQVFISTGRGTWVIPRIADRGMPIDMTAVKRIMMKVKKILPQSLIEKIAEKRINARFDHKSYCLQPKHGVFAHSPIINDEIPNRLASGTLRVKADVRTFTDNGVIFDDDTVEENIDVVVLATGYTFKFPFLDKSVTEVRENHVDELYKYIFPPKLEKLTLGIIGCAQVIGANMPVFEMQCRLSTRVFQRKSTLPCYNDMMLDIESKQEALAQKHVKLHKHTVTVDYIEYMDELTTLNGCRPDLGSLVWSDPKLALTCHFGPCTPYQYRLHGPGKWDGAKQAILTQWDRTLGPLKTRPLGLNEQPLQKNFLLLSLVFIVTICCMLQALFF